KVHAVMTIPPWTILFYPLLMLSALATGIWLKGRQKPDPRLTPYERLWIGLGAFIGAMVMAKLPFILLDPSGMSDGSAFFISGKTILFGLVGGYFGVELVKWRLGIKIKTGDSFAVPVAGSIAVGRLACLAGGCCYGTPTNLPWGLIFPAVDHLPRHPTQLYESAFHLTAALVLAGLQRRGLFRNQLIKLYFISYCLYRFLSEYVRPEARDVFGLTAYQWTAMVLVLLFSWLWWRDSQSGNSTARSQLPFKQSPFSPEIGGEGGRRPDEGA
ncbi:MAG TPA: prolipoprotein diacylglyceryl transferase, partial [Planctomycetaceae bacterium]|nr:prolipoprotein diacylglyceryl transferase [Planctomycetaceae bacterium]